MAPTVSTDDAAALVDGNTAFAFDLYHRLSSSTPGQSFFYSPYSISIALAMTWAGANGDTSTAMAQAMHFTLPPERLHPAFDQLDLALATRGKTDPKYGQPFQLSIVDSMWGEKTTTWKSPFLDTLATSYGAGVYLVDFIHDSAGATKEIDDWVSAQTNGKIVDLIPPGALDDTTRFALVNAVYFHAGWAFPFPKTATADAPFHAPGGDVTLPTMANDLDDVAYGSGDGWQALALPYVGNEIEMDLVVPDGGRFDEVEAKLDQPTWKAMRQGMSSAYGKLLLPRFGVKGASIDLRDALSALGMSVAFTPACDFSGMSDTPLQLMAVYHQAFVAVDEDGTEAAAATASIGGTTSAPMTHFELTVDRPFVFFVRDARTGTLLFAGRYEGS